MFVVQQSAAVAWSVGSMPSNPTVLVRFPAGTGLGVCPLSALSLAVALTFCWPQIPESPTLVCLVFWSRICAHLQVFDPQASGL